MTTDFDVVVERDAEGLRGFSARITGLSHSGAVARRAHGSGPRSDRPLPRGAGSARGNPRIHRRPESANRFMTPRLRVTGKELIAALQRAGFEVTRQRGSHRFLRHSDGRVRLFPFMPGRPSDPACCRKFSETRSSRERSSNNFSRVNSRTPPDQPGLFSRDVCRGRLRHGALSVQMKPIFLNRRQ